MTASRVQIGISQDYLETSKLTSTAGVVHREGTFNASPTDINAVQEIDSVPSAARGILYDSSGNPISSKTVGGIVALTTHVESMNNCIVNNHTHALLIPVTTLAASITQFDTSINVASTIGFSVGNQVLIADASTIEQSLPTITAITGAVLTLDQPIDKAYAISGTTITHVDTNMNGVGSLATPVIYQLQPHVSSVWHITRMNFSMIHSAAADDSKFGSLAALTNGVLFRSTTALNNTQTYANWKDNRDFISDMYDINYSSKAGGGKYGTSGRWSFAERTGAIIRLDGSQGDKIEVLVQDDLSALTSFEINFQGHIDE